MEKPDPSHPTCVESDVVVETSDAASAPENADAAHANEDPLARLLVQAAAAAQAENCDSWWLPLCGFADAAVTDAFDAYHTTTRLNFCAALAVIYFVSTVVWVFDLVADPDHPVNGHYWS